jgi:hypothetical protein
MTYPSWAHRGAYPFVATAFLAGLFALISRPYTEGKPILRWMLGLWLGQNMLVMVSALYRLDLNIGAYRLPYLRLRAGIWMVIVALGLALTASQVWQRLSDIWLLQRISVMVLTLLYACAFVKFADVIARCNLSMNAQETERYRLDIKYLCNLGLTCAGAI